MYMKALMKSIGVKSHLILCWRNHLYWKNSQLCSVETILGNPELSQFSHSVMSNSWDPMACNTPGFPIHHQLPELTQTHVHYVSDAIQPSHPLSSPSPSTFSLSQHQGLSQCVSSSRQVAKVLKFQVEHQSFQWMFRVDFFKIDWFDLLTLQRTLKSLLQDHSLQASVFPHLAFFLVQLSHLDMTTGKSIALTIQTFVSKVMSLLFNMLSRLVIAFLLRSKCLSIS